MEALLTHTCTIKAKVKKQSLAYDQGTSAFTAGETVTGAVSGATATVDMLILDSGSWAAGTAAGHLVLTHVSGTFQDNETIRSTNGTAVADGANMDYLTPGGEYLYYPKTIGVAACRFAAVSPRLLVGDPGAYVKRQTKLYLSPTTVAEGDTVETTVAGYAGAYRVRGVYHVYGYNGVHHLELDLEMIPC